MIAGFVTCLSYYGNIIETLQERCTQKQNTQLQYKEPQLGVITQTKSNQTSCLTLSLISLSITSAS